MIEYRWKRFLRVDTEYRIEDFQLLPCRGDEGRKAGTGWLAQQTLLFNSTPKSDYGI
jgi:hypothetical protein